jgi:hypothetical protein
MMQKTWSPFQTNPTVYSEVLSLIGEFNGRSWVYEGQTPFLA